MDICVANIFLAGSLTFTFLILSFDEQKLFYWSDLSINIKCSFVPFKTICLTHVCEDTSVLCDFLVLLSLSVTIKSLLHLNQLLR